MNGNLKQKVTNTSYKDSTRNEAKVKTRADGKCTFDADNQVLECALKLGVSLKEENPLLGKADASYKNTLNYGGMPNGENKYALYNKEAGVFWNVPLEDDYSMAKTAAEYVKAGVLVLNELAENFTDDMINDVIKELNSDKLTVALKCYVDDRVLTTVGTVEYSTTLTQQEYVDGEYKEVTYGTVHFSGEWIVQAKLDATLKFAGK